MRPPCQRHRITLHRLDLNKLPAARPTARNPPPSVLLPKHRQAKGRANRPPPACQQHCRTSKIARRRFRTSKVSIGVNRDHLRHRHDVDTDSPARIGVSMPKQLPGAGDDCLAITPPGLRACRPASTCGTLPVLSFLKHQHGVPATRNSAGRNSGGRGLAPGFQTGGSRPSSISTACRLNAHVAGPVVG